MGVLDIFRRQATLVEFANASPVSTALGSPYSRTDILSQVVYSEFFAGEIGEVTRQGAMQIPPLKRGRDILTGVIASMPLVQRRGDQDVTPDWLRNTASGISPWHRMAATVDDLIWYDWSLWAVERDASGAIVDGVHVPFERWTVDEYTGVLSIDSQPVDASRVILIPGNGSGGVLATGASTIKGFNALQRAWIGRAQNPIPLVELHQTTDDPLTDGTDEDEEDEINRLVTEWSAARTSPTGSVGFTPHNIELKTHGDVQTDLFVQARNAAVLDVARLLNMPASMLDGSLATASLTYVTTEGKQSEFDALSLPSWLAPIEARLSLDDVSPKGEVIRFDRSQHVALAAPEITAPTED